MGKSDNAAKLVEIKERAARMRHEASKAEGAVHQLEARLREEFGCETLRDAEKLLGRLRREEEDARKKFESAAEEFDHQWSDRLS